MTSPTVPRYLMRALTHTLSCNDDVCSDCKNIRRTVRSRRFREAYEERRHPLKLSDAVRAERAQVQRRMREAATEAARARVRPLLAVVAERYVLDEGLLCGPSREQFIVHARAVAMHLAHVELGMSRAEVARAFGRDRATVLYALRKPGVADAARALAAKLRP